MRKPAYYPIQGGEDLVSPPLSVAPGRCLFTKNYECDPVGRLRRIDGFERCDGRTAPSDATWVEVGTDEGDEAARRAAIEAARALIQVVPGSGAIRGVWIYKDVRYAFRDNAAGDACVMHKESATGWTAVSLGYRLDFTSGGTYEIVQGDVITGAISGVTATVQRVVVTSGDVTDGDAAGYVVFTSKSGNFQAENLNVGANLNVATIADNATAITLEPGGRYEFRNYNFYAQAATKRMYGCDGVNPAFEFDGTVFCPIDIRADYPSHIAVHRNQLFLFFESGLIQHSGPYEPLKWLAIDNSSEMSIGDTCVGGEVQPGGVLAIFGRNSTTLLYGNDVSDWEMKPLSQDSGAVEWTIQQLHVSTFLDDRGVTNLTAVQEFGDFSSKTISQAVSPVLKLKQSTAISSLRVKAKDQYRLFFEDGTGLSFTFSQGSLLGITRIDYGMPVRCCCAGEISGVETLLFGSDDGYVYHLDKGTSFDGEEVEAMVRLPFNHLSSPENIKRFFKAILEIDAPNQTALEWVEDYDYGEEGGRTQNLSATSGGGFWNIDNWNEFAWSTASVGSAVAYLSGSGKNIGIFIGSWSTYDEPHTLQGITLHYSIRGLSR